MDDYEHTNAQEWDLNKGCGRPRPKSEGSWEVVHGSKKKQQQQTPQHPPFTTPPSVENVAPRNQQTGPPHPTQTQTPPKLGNQRQQQRPLRESVASPPPKHFNRQVQGHRSGTQPSGSERQSQVVRQQQSRRPPQRLTEGRGNIGERLWRKHEEPHARVRIPIELATHMDKGHHRIAQHHGTFVYHEEEPGGNASRTFGIWGDPQAVAATVEDITSWIEGRDSSQKSKRAGCFAKIASLTPKQRNHAEKEWEREVRKHRFRQSPSLGQGFEAILSFHWPVKDYRPEEILGLSYEALDPIRMEFKCYVLFDKDQGQFQVMGRSAAVLGALTRLRGTCFQIAASQIASVQRYLLHPAVASSPPRRVLLTEYELPRILQGKDERKVKVGQSPRADDVSSDNSDGGQHTTTSEEATRSSILKMLPKLHYFHGSLHKRIRLGTFLVGQIKRSEDNRYDLDEYQSMIKASQFTGRVTQELGERAMESTAHDNLRNAAGFLSPQDNTIKDLAAVRPIYTAIFTFVDPAKGEAGDIRLTMTWEESQDSITNQTTFDNTFKKWRRLDRDIQAPYPLLNVALSDLSTGMAWQFDLHAAQCIEESRLPAELSDFGDKVRPDAKLAHKAVDPSATDISFMTYRSSFTYLKHVEQRITYRYQDIHSDYIFELSRFQHREFPSRKALIASSITEPTVYEPRWGLSLHRNQWDTWFAHNERLPIGEKAVWPHEEDDWFPKDYATASENDQSGFAQLMKKLERFKGLIIGEEEEDLSSGMQVG